MLLRGLVRVREQALLRGALVGVVGAGVLYVAHI